MEVGELFVNAIEHWRIGKGLGTALIPSPLNDKTMVLGVLQRIYARSPTCKTVIITTTFSERSDITEFITQQQDAEENNEEFKKLLNDGNIKVLTYDFIKKMSFNFSPLLCILYRPETVCAEVARFVGNCKFRLIVLNRLLSNAEDMTEIYKLAPILEDFKANVVEQVRLSTPVEEEQIGIDIPADSEDFKLLNYYNEYITTSISIFGSFDIMQQANTGNLQLNISSMQICNQIAQENGWSEQLDMNVEFNLKIDELYNPIALKERASKTYEVIRNRSQLLSDYKGKLDIILDIVNNNRDKKILIINKRADFASAVTDYLNTLSETDICMNYHDKVDSVPAIDSNGNPVFYKSGARKGERKTMGVKSQKTLAEILFNAGKINVLSTNNAPDKDLDIDVDIIIITSPMCEDITSYMYRLSNINFRLGKIMLYSLYCRTTLEQRLLENKTLATNHSVKNSSNDENYSDFIVVD